MPPNNVMFSLCEIQQPKIQAMPITSVHQHQPHPHLQTRAQTEDHVSLLCGLRCPLPVERLLQNATFTEMHYGVYELCSAMRTPAAGAVSVQSCTLRHVKQTDKLSCWGAGSTHLCYRCNDRRRK